jgi:hypothetical protein
MCLLCFLLTQPLYAYELISSHKREQQTKKLQYQKIMRVSTRAHSTVRNIILIHKK